MSHHVIQALYYIIIYITVHVLMHGGFIITLSLTS